MVRQQSQLWRCQPAEVGPEPGGTQGGRRQRDGLGRGCAGRIGARHESSSDLRGRQPRWRRGNIRTIVDRALQGARAGDHLITPDAVRPRRAQAREHGDHFIKAPGRDSQAMLLVIATDARRVAQIVEQHISVAAGEELVVAVHCLGEQGRAPG